MIMLSTAVKVALVEGGLKHASTEKDGEQKILSVPQHEAYFDTAGDRCTRNKEKQTIKAANVTAVTECRSYRLCARRKMK